MIFEFAALFSSRDTNEPWTGVGTSASMGQTLPSPLPSLAGWAGHWDPQPREDCSPRHRALIITATDIFLSVLTATVIHRVIVPHLQDVNGGQLPEVA